MNRLPTISQAIGRRLGARKDGGRLRLVSLPARPLRVLTASAVSALLVGGLYAGGGLGSAVASTLVANPSFEADWTASTSATCWQIGNVGTGSATLAPSSTAHSGSLAAQLNVTSLDSGGKRQVVINQDSGSCAPDVSIGHTYAVSAWYRSSAALRMAVYYRDSAGAWHSWAQSPRWSSSSSWRKMSFTTAALPAGATALSFGPSLSRTGWMLVDDAAMADTTTPTSTTTTTPTSTTTTATSWWSPAMGTAWQWQLSNTVDTTVPVPVYDIDGEQNTAATVAALHARGARVICYIDAGGWEDYRNDAASFPDSVKGNTISGWPSERWLDIRQISILIPIMEKRVQDCANKGFDALEPDLQDGYTNNTGFPLTAADQYAYNTALAALAHRYNIGVALKNDPEQAAVLEPSFDFAIVEECYQYSECAMYSPFITAGKAVLEVEYKGLTTSFCPSMKTLGFSSMKKNLSLDVWREAC